MYYSSIHIRYCDDASTQSPDNKTCLKKPSLLNAYVNQPVAFLNF